MTLDTTNHSGAVGGNPQLLLQQARGGDEAARGQLLMSFGNYLTLLARVQIGPRLQGKVDEGDIVQETFLDAHRQFAQFRGNSEAEVAAWLRTILAGKLGQVMRRYVHSKGRDVAVERELAARLEESSQALDGGLAASISSPSQRAQRRERSVLLADALAKLSEEHREVIILHHLQGLTFGDVAQRLGKTENSVQKTWIRALANLRQKLRGVM